MQLRIADFGLRIGLSLMFTVFCSAPARAEIKIIEAEHTYAFGVNDTAANGRRIAVQEAKRKALESASSLAAGLTGAKDLKLTKEDVRAYVAGFLETGIVSEQTRGTAEHPTIYIKTRCKFDVDALMARIGQYQKNEDLSEQLRVSVQESDALRNERNALIKRLGKEKDGAAVDKIRENLDTLLAREEANDNTTRVWAALAPSLETDDESSEPLNASDLEKAMVVLERAVKVNPQDQRARCLLAELYRYNHDIAGAERELRTAIQNNPSSPVPHIRLGLLLKEHGKYADTLREFQFVKRMRPRHFLLSFYTGMTYRDLGKCGKAVQNLNRFLKDKRVNDYPVKKEKASIAVEECGGERPGRHKRERT